MVRVVVEHDLAVRQDVAAVGDLEREVHVLLDEQHGAAALLRELAHDRQQPLHDHRREPEAELVEEQQLRLPCQRARDREHLLLAPGEQADAPPRSSRSFGKYS